MPLSILIPFHTDAYPIFKLCEGGLLFGISQVTLEAKYDWQLRGPCVFPNRFTTPLLWTRIIDIYEDCYHPSKIGLTILIILRCQWIMPPKELSLPDHGIWISYCGKPHQPWEHEKVVRIPFSASIN